MNNAPNYPAILYPDYDTFEKTNALGIVLFTYDAQGNIVGMLNKCPGCGKICGVNFCEANGKPCWRLESGGDGVSPITITPSIRHIDSHCGWHGFLTNGEWVPC